MIETKRRVQYFDIPTRQLIGRCSGTRMPFVWTVNPYRGCEFGCQYCYARYAHEFMELRDPLQFETQIYAKRFAPESLRQELRKVKPGQSIWIGTATDPYQPAERRFRLTRKILEVFARERGLQGGHHDQIGPDPARCRLAGRSGPPQHHPRQPDHHDAG